MHFFTPISAPDLRGAAMRLSLGGFHILRRQKREKEGFSKCLRKYISLNKGPFKYYVIKGLGGWGKANDYDWLQGWVTGFGSMIT